MSCVCVCCCGGLPLVKVAVTLTTPLISGVLSGVIGAAVTAAAAGMGLNADNGVEETAVDKSVELCLNNASEVVAGASIMQRKRFFGDGIAVEFCIDENGRSFVRAFGQKSEEELRELGETMAGRIMQQYAFHRVVAEMRERNMNIVEEEVEEDGTVRLLVRVHHG